MCSRHYIHTCAYLRRAAGNTRLHAGPTNIPGRQPTYLFQDNLNLYRTVQKIDLIKTLRHTQIVTASRNYHGTPNKVTAYHISLCPPDIIRQPPIITASRNY